LKCNHKSAAWNQDRNPKSQSRIITVGESKTDAGTGRTIPMNEDLFAAAVEYAKWYTGKFGASRPDWYVFPFGSPRPSDPTRPQTSLKTAWRNVRGKAEVEGRFHDTRHTFVTDLAESGAADEVIRDMAGHVSKDMLKHYSHTKRRAVDGLATQPRKVVAVSEKVKNESNLESVPQVPPQVAVVNWPLPEFLAGKTLILLAPQGGFEPTSLRLTAERLVAGASCKGKT
jgi:Phage integrase family